MDQESQDFQKVWDLEVERARQAVDQWLDQGSEELLVEQLLEQEDLERDQLQESVRSAVEVAVQALEVLGARKLESLELPESPQE